MTELTVDRPPDHRCRRARRHLRAARGGQLAGARAVLADRPGGVLPGEGRLDPRGEADLHRLRGPRRVPRVRARARRAVRHLGRAVRARAPPPQAPRSLTLTAAPLSVRRVDLVDVAAEELGGQVDHDHEDQVGAVLRVGRPGLDRAPVDHDHRAVDLGQSLAEQPAERDPAVDHDVGIEVRRLRPVPGGTSSTANSSAASSAAQCSSSSSTASITRSSNCSPRVRCSGTSTGASWPRTPRPRRSRRRVGAASRAGPATWRRSVRTGATLRSVGALAGGAPERRAPCRHAGEPRRRAAARPRLASNRSKVDAGASASRRRCRGTSRR